MYAFALMENLRKEMIIMWIPKTITSSEGSGEPFAANIIYSEGGKLGVSGLERLENVEMCVPYGFYCAPPKGTRVVMLPVGSSAVVGGVTVDSPLSLQSGEIGLYSSGGASIVLKNDGSVVINGHVFQGE